MALMKAYEFIAINKSINNILNLTRTIKIISFSCYNKSINKDLKIGVYDNNTLIDDFYINPRKCIKVKSKYLNDDDKKIVVDFFEDNGMILLDYQFFKIDYRKLMEALK